MRFILMFSVVVSMCAALQVVGAEKPPVVEIWPGTAPDESGNIGEEMIRMSPKLNRKQVEVTESTRLVTNVTKPTLTIYRPAKDRNTGTSTQHPFKYYVGGLQVPHPCPPWGDNANATLHGIDTYAWTSRHEYRHSQQFNSWWPTGWNPPNNDQDYDLIPDNLEPTIGASAGGPYDPTTSMTYTPPSGWTTLNDTERICLFTQQPWVIGSLEDEDWASPGSQW
jgi:hypothetical protein